MQIRFDGLFAFEKKRKEGRMCGLCATTWKVIQNKQIWHVWIWVSSCGTFDFFKEFPYGSIGDHSKKRKENPLREKCKIAAKKGRCPSIALFRKVDPNFYYR